MIDPRELRIGNWLYDQGYYKITEVTGWEQTEPIPLTVEILFKCGFVLSKEHGFTKNNICIVFERNVFQFWYSEGNGVILDHLHQLQNLYFALTGKDLEINL